MLAKYDKEFQSAEILVKNALLALKLLRDDNNSLEHVKQASQMSHRFSNPPLLNFYNLYSITIKLLKECELEQSVGLIKCVRNELEHYVNNLSNIMVRLPDSLCIERVLDEYLELVSVQGATGGNVPTNRNPIIRELLLEKNKSPNKTLELSKHFVRNNRKRLRNSLVNQHTKLAGQFSFMSQYLRENSGSSTEEKSLPIGHTESVNVIACDSLSNIWIRLNSDVDTMEFLSRKLGEWCVLDTEDNSLSSLNAQTSLRLGDSVAYFIEPMNVWARGTIEDKKGGQDENSQVFVTLLLYDWGTVVRSPASR